MIIEDSAIVLTARKYSDTSVICTLLSRNHGLVSVLAKGARRPKSRFGSCLEPTSCILCTVATKPNRDLQILSHAEIQIPLRRLVDSYQNLYCALKIVDTIKRCRITTLDSEQVYELAYTCLRALNENSGNAHRVLFAFHLRLAAVLGFVPNFSIPYHENDEALAFSVQEGCVQVIDQEHHTLGIRVDETTLVLLNELLDGVDLNTPAASIGPLTQNVVQSILVHYYRVHIDISLNLELPSA